MWFVYILMLVTCVSYSLIWVLVSLGVVANLLQGLVIITVRTALVID